MSTKSFHPDRRIRKSKAALKESLISLMKEKDFKDVSITDIVQTADLNRGTFYKHFQYKEELLEEVIDDVIKDLIDSYREPYQGVEAFSVSKLTSSTIKIFDHVAKYTNFYSLLVKSNVLFGLQNRICNELKKLVLQDLANNPLHSNINADLLASYQAHAIWGMISEWIQSGFTYSSAYMAEQLLAILHSIHSKNANRIT
ncbi:TetR/AcrR family transcriptional regulator [Bacillus sp. FJAT-22090]|uniref:TetR/AcrR family transcriptional regulator n=1 Tax=Bacillus sp. FJAT-22090 TaxID=1581038 RepID=UPI0011A68E64|nr:TetR/AcrR family transcriptional regulator [Bacillus sp. FJAT-22090]